MNTPIIDFVKQYNKKRTTRLHMPGHKGKRYLGVEKFDITEFIGADSLYEASGIILESEKNASELFGCPTYYSTEGSSHCIRAMVHMVKQYALVLGKKPLILCARNCHKAFVNAVGIMGVDVEWITGENSWHYLSCNLTAKDIDKRLSEQGLDKPIAVYLTSPDYLGNLLDIDSISYICKKHGVLLMVDNAHGAYTRFLKSSLHPIDLGADICCDSAHKTLPSITGGAYLHINKRADKFFIENAKLALGANGSTSPSYIVMQSLDYVNKYLSKGYAKRLNKFAIKLYKLKVELEKYGYQIIGDEKLKITILTKCVGYMGRDIADILFNSGIVVEAFDSDYVVMMFSVDKIKALKKVKKVLTSIVKRHPITVKPPKVNVPKVKYSVSQAMFKNYKKVEVDNALGKVFYGSSLSCPPAVPIAVCGEVIDVNTIENMRYYGIREICVIDE